MLENLNQEETWQSVLAQIKLNMSPANFTTWFKNTGILEIKNSEATIATPNSFVREWIENKYSKIILKILHDLDNGIREVKYVVVNRSRTKPIEKNSFSPSETDQLDFQELKIDKETNLNPRYLFDNFVVGPFNELPHAAASAVAKTPGSIYNPLFIYGGVGLGKTHLLQAVGNEVLTTAPQKRIKYLPAEKFVSEIVSSIRNNSIDVLKRRYQDFDVLIIDDVQFLAGKEKSQEEFFHLFNSLYEKNRQIIISSDRPPKAIPSLAERLRSRFEGGMIADISYPDLETRIAILKTKTREKKFDLDDKILEYIASSIQRNIRELEGALNRLIACQKVRAAQPLTVESAKSLLKNIISPSIKMVSPQKLIQIVAEFYNLREKEILSETRRKEIVFPRQIAMYLLREELQQSYPSIGKKFGGKDHTTVIHSCKKISEEAKTNENLEEEITLIKQKIFSV